MHRLYRMWYEHVTLVVLLGSYTEFQRDKLSQVAKNDDRLQFELSTIPSNLLLQVMLATSTDGSPSRVSIAQHEGSRKANNCY